MKDATRILFYVMLSLLARAASGQGRTGAGTWGFVNVRYDTRSPASMYTGYGWHAVFAFGGVVHNRRTGYADLVGGVGVVFKTGAVEHWLMIATAGTGTRSSTRGFWLPTLRTGSFTTRANVTFTAPCTGTGARKLSISPVTVTRPLGRWLSAGMALELAAVEGSRTRLAAGFDFRVKLPGAALGVDALHDVTGSGAQMRVFFGSTF
jgi:hypothetical protein